MTPYARPLSLLAAAALVAAPVAGLAAVSAAPAALAAPTTGAMVPTELSRIVDTREGVGSNGARVDDQTTRIQVTGSVPVTGGDSRTVVPEGADAVVLNLTAVSPTTAGFFTAYPAGAQRPTTSNINFVAGDTIAGGGVVPLSDDGAFEVYSRGSAHMLVDVAGWYSGGTYNAAPIQRLIDTRKEFDNNGYMPGATRTRVKTTAKQGDLVTLNLTVDRPSEPGFAFVEPFTGSDVAPGREATFSSLNWTPGEIISNTAQVVAGVDGEVVVETRGNTTLVVDQLRVENAGSTAVTMLDRPQRQMDTREATGSKLTGRSQVSLQDDLTTLADPDYTAAIVNVTVTEPEADGFISIGADLPTGAQRTSVLNFAAGDTRANLVTIPADLAGSLDVYSHVPAHVVIDVVGYTAQPNADIAAGVTISNDPIPVFYADAGGVGDTTLHIAKDSLAGKTNWNEWSIVDNTGVLVDGLGEERNVSMRSDSLNGADTFAADLATFGDGDMTLDIPIVSASGALGGFIIEYSAGNPGPSVVSAPTQTFESYGSADPTQGVGWPGQRVNVTLPPAFTSWQTDTGSTIAEVADLGFELALASDAPGGVMTFTMPTRSELIAASTDGLAGGLPDRLEIVVVDSPDESLMRFGSLNLAVK